MKTYIFCLFLLMISIYNYAQPRFLDSSFGNNGKVVTDFGSDEQINSIAFQSDKKIIAAGYYDLVRVKSFSFLTCALVRYNTNGKVDSTFGKNGLIYFDDRFSEISAIVTQKDDKIIATGYADAYGGHTERLIILQCKQNGELDSSFAQNGVASYGISPYNFYGKAIALQNDGKILTVGVYTTGNSWDSTFAFAARFNKIGTLDSGFGKNGISKLVVGFKSYANSVAVNSKNEIIIAGYNTTEPYLSQSFLIGLTSGGELNKNFGSNGIIISKLHDSTSFATVALTEDEKIIAAGSVRNGGEYNFLLGKYNQNGTIDSSFGINGIVNSDLGFSDQLNSIVISPDETITAGGSSFNSSENKTAFALSCYHSNGALDNSFGANGKIFTFFSGHTSSISKILLQPDGKIVAGGSSERLRYGYSDFALSRYKNNDSINKPHISIAQKPNDKNSETVTFIAIER